MTEYLVTDVVDGMLKVQFNRPEKKNAITRAMYIGLTAALTEAADNPAIRVVFITGTPGCFTSGNDISDFLHHPHTDADSPPIQFLTTISQFKKPIVAAVTGVAVGIGTTMLLHCDLVYAAAGANFQLPFVNLGLVPEAGSTIILPQLMGYHRAAALLMLGDFFDAPTAQALGLVNEVFDDDRLLAATLEKVQLLAAKPPAALRLTKSLLKETHADLIRETIYKEGEQFQQCLQSPEAREAMQAFMERRPPDFSKFT